MNIKPQLSCLMIWILGILLTFLFFFLNSRVLQNSVIRKKYVVYSWSRFQSWMRTNPKLKEIGDENEHNKENNIEKRNPLGLYAVWHFGDKVDFFFFS